MTRRDRELAAVAELEALLPHLRQLVNEVRANRVDAYASLYEARHRMGRLVAACGYGRPSRSRAVRHDFSELDGFSPSLDDLDGRP